MYDPERYENFKSTAKQITAQFFGPLLKKIDFSHQNSNKNGLILDFGCGAGSTCFKYILPIALKFNYKIHGVDISEDMIKFAQQNYKNPSIKYIVANILESSSHSQLMAQKYDYIFSNLVFHFVHDYRTTIFELMNKLSVGGKMGLTVVTESNFYYRAFEFFGTSKKWGQYMQGYENFIPYWYINKLNPEIAYREAIEEAGGKIIFLKTDRFSTIHSSNELIEFAMSLNPFIKSIPKELHKDLKSEYGEFLQKCCGFDYICTDTDKYESVNCILSILATK